VTDQWHFDPDTYLSMVRSEIPSYDRLQSILAESTGSDRSRVLDLGSGTGVTAAAVLARHPEARLTGVDSSATMLNHARALVPDATFVEQPLEEPFPGDQFDLVVSAFAIHHLPADAKADLFRRVAEVLTAGGRFVLCDVVIPTQHVDRPVPLEPGVDVPSSLEDQISWLLAAGLLPEVILAEDDLAIIAADRA
jgi:trans-aconitate methyltransferase